MSENSNDDEKHFLTDHDLAFLRGERDITEGSARNARNRIRTRFRCALEDIELLLYRTTSWRHDRLVQGMSRDDDLYREITLAIGLLYSLAVHSDIDEEQIFTEGVRAGAGPFVKDVDVNFGLEYQSEYNFDSVKSKVENGKLPTAWEMGMLVYHGHEDRVVEFGEEERPIIEFIRYFRGSRNVDDEHFISY